MEGGLAVLGQYEGEAFDQHNCPQEQATFDGGLSESVSFGRFAVDSLSWVKRSSFNHNQYLEELGSCSTPGSVRQKKAYFEAYYKAIAKRKALEKAAAEGFNEGHMGENEFTNVENTSIKQGDSLAIEANGSTSSTDLPKISDGMLQSSSTSTCEENHSAVNLPHTQDSVAEDAEEHWESNPQSVEEMTHNNSLNPFDTLLPKDDESKPDFIAESLHNAVVQITDELRAQILQENLESSIQEELVDSEITVLEFDENIAQEGSDVNHDAEVVVALETSEFAVLEVLHRPNQISVNNLVAAPETTSETRQQIRTPLQQNSKVKLTILSDSSSLPKACDGLASKRQGHKGVTDSKRSMNVGTSHNVTVPRPFALSTNKRSIVAHTTQEQGGPRSSQKHVRNGVSPLRKSQVPSKVDKKCSTCRPFVEANTLRKGKYEQQLRGSTLAKCSLIPNELGKLGVAASKELKHDDKRPNELAHGSSRNSRPSPKRSNTSPFCLRSDERAEKRKQFNLRMKAKEAEKYQTEAKAKEEVEEEIKQLRRSLKFKATPISDVYQDSLQPKLEARKARIPTMPTKSPKLGQKRMVITERHVSPVYGLKAVSHVWGTTDTRGKEETASVRSLRNASPLAKKSNVLTKTSEGLEIQPPEVVEGGSSPQLDSRSRPDPALGNDLETSLGPELTHEIGQFAVDIKGIISLNIPPTTRGQEHVEASAASLQDPSISQEEMAVGIANRRERKTVTMKEHFREASSATKERPKKESLDNCGKIVPRREATSKGAPRDCVRRASPARCGGNKVQKEHSTKQCLEHTEGLDGAAQNRQRLSHVVI